MASPGMSYVVPTPERYGVAFPSLLPSPTGARRREIKHERHKERITTVDMKKYATEHFIKVDDVRDGPIEDQIAVVKAGQFDKPNLVLESGDVLSLNATNRKKLVRAYGTESDLWIGKMIKLFLGMIEYQGSDHEAVLVEPISPPIKEGKAKASKADKADKATDQKKPAPLSDENGSVAFAVDRIQFQKPDGSFILKDGKHDKVFRQRRPDPDRPGQWIHNKEGAPVVPYRLPQVLEAIAAGHPVFIAEGEAKADLLWSWNVAATCCAGGAKKWKPEHSEFLRGAEVVLLPDHDGAGYEHCHVVGSSLSGIAKRIRVLALNHAKAKDDIIDWAAGGGTREQLDAALGAAPDWKPLEAEEIDKLAADERADAQKREDELLAALEKAEPGLAYRRQRDEVAKELKVGKTDIEAELKRRRENAPLYGHWVVEPWPDPADGDALLRDIIRRIRRHVICSFDDALVIALWIVFSWIHEDAAVHSPLLLVTSAEPESGKTTTLQIVSYLAPRAIASVEISKAALYRAIKHWNPSFVIDEFDTVS
jgi:hypothetical protein